MGSAASDLDPIDRSWANNPIIRFVLICAVFVTLYSGVAGGVRERFTGEQAMLPLAICTKIDFQMDSCDKGGNVFLICQGFTVADATMLNMYYFRSNYTLWPRYVVPPDPSRRDATRQLAYNQAVPDERWLADHNVKTVLLCVKGEVVPSAFKYDVPGITATDASSSPPAPASATAGTFAWCGLYLALMLACGYAVVCLLMGSVRRGAVELIGASAAAGAAVFSLTMIFVSMAAYAPTRTIVLCIGGGAMAIMGLLVWRGRLTVPEKPAGGWFQVRPVWTLIPLIALIGGIAAIVDDTLIQQTLLWDAFAIWQLKAKVLFSQALAAHPAYFTTASLSYSHLRYPVLVPMLSSGVDAMVGHMDEIVQKAPFLLLYLALGALVYGAIAMRRGAAAAIVATSLLLTLEDFLHLGGTGTADLPLAAFAAGSFVFLLRWVERQEMADLLMTLLFSVACVWSKNEGAAIAAANLVVLWLLSPRRLAPRTMAIAAGFAIVVVLIYLPWMNYIKDMPRMDEDYAGRLTIANIRQGLPSIAHVTSAVLRQMINVHKWGVFWLLPPLLTLLALLGGRRASWRPLIALWLLLTINVCVWIVVFLVTPLQFDPLLPSVGGRLLMQVAPAGALLIGLQWPQGSVAVKPSVTN